MFKFLISLLFVFNSPEEIPTLDNACRQVVICECYPSKGGDTCILKVVTECD